MAAAKNKLLYWDFGNSDKPSGDPQMGERWAGNWPHDRLLHDRINLLI